MRCELRSAEERLFDGEATLVVAHGPWGEFGILPRHAPLISALDAGVLRIRMPDGEKVFAVRGGLLRVEADRVSILAVEAVASEAIDPVGVSERRAALEAKRRSGEGGGAEEELAYLRAQEKARGRDAR